MKLTREEVEHLAELARLKLSEEEQEKFRDQLSSILEYVNKLREVSTDTISVAAHITGLKNILRPDTAEKRASEEAKRLVQAAPGHEGNFIKTKPVFE